LGSIHACISFSTDALALQLSLQLSFSPDACCTSIIVEEHTDGTEVGSKHIRAVAARGPGGLPQVARATHYLLHLFFFILVLLVGAKHVHIQNTFEQLLHVRQQQQEALLTHQLQHTTCFTFFFLAARFQ
jgi:hypothetical protein